MDFIYLGQKKSRRRRRPKSGSFRDERKKKVEKLIRALYRATTAGVVFGVQK